MNDDSVTAMTWAERAADRSLQRSRTRNVQQATEIVEAAHRLILLKGGSFTVQDLIKEAHIALHTLYAYFEGRDQVVLAVIENMHAKSYAVYEELAQKLDDPIARLRFYIEVGNSFLANTPRDDGVVRYITLESWRLQSLYPEEIENAMRPLQNLIQRELEAATDAGLLRVANPEYDAWLINKLIAAVYAHYAFAENEETTEEICDRVWAFCLAAVGGLVEEETSPPSGAKRVKK
jgi:TetR/AcrR family transcriptional regulator